MFDFLASDAKPAVDGRSRVADVLCELFWVGDTARVGEDAGGDDRECEHRVHVGSDSSGWLGHSVLKWELGFKTGWSGSAGGLGGFRIHF